MGISPTGMMYWGSGSWTSVLLFGAVLLVLTAGNNINQDGRQAVSPSCTGEFDLYFVLDK
jgi:hypothetical protein